MKICHLIAVVFCATMVFVSCSSDVDLIADGNGEPIVYALLDSKADTNYVKITHTMNQGDAFASATNPEFSDYPGKLDVRLTEYCNGDSIRQIILDTITIFNKEEGIFYAPAQKLYYTTERLGMNKEDEHYSYKLTAVLPDRTLTAEAKMVGSKRFYVRSSVADYSGGYFKNPQQILVVPAENAGIYDIQMSFTFLERRTWTSDTIVRTMKWHMGTYYLFELDNHMSHDAFVITYHPNDLYVALNNFLGDDTIVPGLRRYIIDDPLEITVTAGGPNLSEYVYLNELNSTNINDDNIVTHINGGYGVFSSRMTTTRTMRLGGTTVPELVDNTRWGFKYIGGHL